MEKSRLLSDIRGIKARLLGSLNAEGLMTIADLEALTVEQARRINGVSGDSIKMFKRFGVEFASKSEETPTKAKNSPKYAVATNNLGGLAKESFGQRIRHQEPLAELCARLKREGRIIS